MDEVSWRRVQQISERIIRLGKVEAGYEELLVGFEKCEVGLGKKLGRLRIAEVGWRRVNRAWERRIKPEKNEAGYKEVARLRKE